MMTVHTDYLGTPREIKDGGTTVWKWENKDIYGSNLPSVTTIEYNLRFSGQYFDKENKLHYNINRTYNPQLGRYMQSDPKGLAAGFNTYNYVKNNPLNAVDPLGLDFISGSVQPIVIRMISNPNTVPEGYLGIGLHGIYENNINPYNKFGAFQLEKNSALYNMIDKDSGILKKLKFDENGQTGIDGKALAQILKSISGIDYSKYKGIYLYACNSGNSISPFTSNLNAQDFADEMNISTYAFDGYLMMTQYPNYQNNNIGTTISGYYNRDTYYFTKNNLNATDIIKLFKPH